MGRPTAGLKSRGYFAILRSNAFFSPAPSVTGVAESQNAIPLDVIGIKVAKTNSDQLHGTLDMLVLKVLDNGPVHGYGIAVRLQQLSSAVLRVEEGSLYPALYRMEARGWLSSEWRPTDTGRRARFYRLTRTGRSQLADETENWGRLTRAVHGVLTG